MLKPSFRKHIEKTTERLRLKSEQPEVIPVNLDNIAASSKIHLSSAPLDDFSGMSFIENGVAYVLFSKWEKNKQRTRFTIAHEIGHIALHHNIPVSISEENGILLRDANSSTGTDFREVEANYFAACLLMPREIIEREVRTLDTSGFLTEDEIETLARRFDVSIMAMTIRLANLGYL